MIRCLKSWFIRNVSRTMCSQKWSLFSFSRPLFEGDNEFCLCLKESFPNLKTRKLTRVEWGTIRRLMGKPRRYAAKLCSYLTPHTALMFFLFFFFKIILIVFSLYIYTSYIFTQFSHLLVVPSRCSSAFFNEERTALRQKRQKMRLLQQGKMSDVSNCKDLPDEIPLRLNIGTKVTGKMSEIKALTVSSSNHHNGSLHYSENPNTVTCK